MHTVHIFFIFGQIFVLLYSIIYSINIINENKQNIKTINF